MRLDLRFDQLSDEQPRGSKADVFCGDEQVLNIDRILFAVDRSEAYAEVHVLIGVNIRSGLCLTGDHARGLSVSLDGGRPWPARLHLVHAATQHAGEETRSRIHGFDDAHATGDITWTYLTAEAVSQP